MQSLTSLPPYSNTRHPEPASVPARPSKTVNQASSWADLSAKLKSDIDPNVRVSSVSILPMHIRAMHCICPPAHPGRHS
eukprot:766676-Hanusia_phi.AAC.3